MPSESKCLYSELDILPTYERLSLSLAMLLALELAVSDLRAAASRVCKSLPLYPSPVSLSQACFQRLFQPAFSIMLSHSLYF